MAYCAKGKKMFNSKYLLIVLSLFACNGQIDSEATQTENQFVTEYAPANGAECYYIWANPVAALSPCPGDEAGFEFTDKQDVAKGFHLGPRYTVARLVPGACYTYVPECNASGVCKAQTVGTIGSDRCD